MKKLKILFTLLAFTAFGQSGSAQLTGEWTDDIGACYKIRQVGNEIYWSMDDSPRVINVFTGLKVKDIINGKWADVPGGSMSGNGMLSLRDYRWLDMHTPSYRIKMLTAMGVLIVENQVRSVQADTR